MREEEISMLTKELSNTIIKRATEETDSHAEAIGVFALITCCMLAALGGAAGFPLLSKEKKMVMVEMVDNLLSTIGETVIEASQTNDAFKE